jgi:primosomal protein N' (replication factor Y)
VIIDEEQDSAYKQDQVPYYHAREAAMMRVGIEKAKLILASRVASLESIYLARKNKAEYKFIPESRVLPEIKILDMRAEYIRRNRAAILPKYLQDAFAASLQNKAKALLFLNRKGFATYSLCNSCGKPLVCGNCNANLVYRFKDNSLFCRYCNFRMMLPNICPNCNAGYIKLGGSGTERIENELARIFPGAKIIRAEHPDSPLIKEADIVVSTSAIIKHGGVGFDLTGVMGIDDYLNRVDFRAGEKTFELLSGLAAITVKRMIILSFSPKQHCFQAVLKNDPGLFYDQELKQRKQLLFPPYRHLALIKLRGRQEEKIKEAAFSLFKRLSLAAKGSGLKLISVNPGQPDKLRGNFYWQILISSSGVKRLNRFLRINLKNIPHSGIIVTVDVDPL